MDLEEAAAGTALMWLWEKQLTALALEEAGRPPLTSLDRDAQFVVSSLVYNSGNPHASSTLSSMLALDTAPYLAPKSGPHSRRPRLAIEVHAPEAALTEILAGARVPSQGTGWVSVAGAARPRRGVRRRRSVARGARRSGVHHPLMPSGTPDRREGPLRQHLVGVRVGCRSCWGIGYTHVSSDALAEVVSPLDRLELPGEE